MAGSEKHIHIISFDVPYPANYGGVIDIYYKIKALYQSGFLVHLHCFQYGRDESKQLNKICATVSYYKRKVYKNPFYGSLPYIVATRSSGDLLKNLKQDSYPILFEGLHTTFFLNHPDLETRFKIVRMHNIEHDYYAHLEKAERSYFKKYFFRIESEKLKKYQQVLKHTNLILAISQNDEKYLKKRFDNVLHIPPFHGNSKVLVKSGMGKYILYHGNLSVPENNEAALYLVNSVFSKLKYPCLIAGNNPSKELRNAIAAFSHISLIDNTTSADIEKLIAEAQINVLHTFQATGIKLKLINALFRGRHCIGNKEMIKNTGVEELCQIADDAESYVNCAKELWDKPFGAADADKRKEILLGQFSDEINAANLEKFIPVAISDQPSIESVRAEKEDSPLSRFSTYISLFSL